MYFLGFCCSVVFGLFGGAPTRFGVLFLLFRHYDQKEDFWQFCIIIAIMFVVEIFYDMPLWLLFVLFVVLRYIVIAWLTHFNVKYIIHIAQVILTYIGLYVALVCISIITHATLDLNPIVLVYYCLFEIVLVSIYEYTI